jgi:hypothetical protein
VAFEMNKVAAKLAGKRLAKSKTFAEISEPKLQ